MITTAVSTSSAFGVPSHITTLTASNAMDTASVNIRPAAMVFITLFEYIFSMQRDVVRAGNWLLVVSDTFSRRTTENRIRLFDTTKIGICRFHAMYVVQCIVDLSDVRPVVNATPP